MICVDLGHNLLGNLLPPALLRDNAATLHLASAYRQPHLAAAAAPAVMTIKRVCVFCGSKHGVRPGYTEAARQLGRVMVAKQIGLVYGGGTVGLMGEVARTVQDGLGPQQVLGVIPQALTPREISNELIGDTKVGKTTCVCVGAWYWRGWCGAVTSARMAGGHSMRAGGWPQA